MQPYIFMKIHVSLNAIKNLKQNWDRNYYCRRYKYLYYHYIPYNSTSAFTPLCFYTLKSHKDIRDLLSESEPNPCIPKIPNLNLKSKGPRKEKKGKSTNVI